MRVESSLNTFKQNLNSTIHPRGNQNACLTAGTWTRFLLKFKVDSFQLKIIMSFNTESQDEWMEKGPHLYVQGEPPILDVKPWGITTDIMFPPSLNKLNRLSNHITDTSPHFRDPTDHQSFPGKRKGRGGGRWLHLFHGSSYKNRPYFWSSLGQRDGRVPPAWRWRFQFSSSSPK